MPEKLSSDQIAAILSTGRRSQKKDPTEPREVTTWFRLNHTIRRIDVGGDCANPECKDPRDKSKLETIILVEVKGKKICRYCFLGGYLSDRTATS